MNCYKCSAPAVDSSNEFVATMETVTVTFTLAPVACCAACLDVDAKAAGEAALPALRAKYLMAPATCSDCGVTCEGGQWAPIGIGKAIEQTYCRKCAFEAIRNTWFKEIAELPDEVALGGRPAAFLQCVDSAKVSRDQAFAAVAGLIAAGG